LKGVAKLGHQKITRSHPNEFGDLRDGSTKSYISICSVEIDGMSTLQQRKASQIWFSIAFSVLFQRPGLLRVAASCLQTHRGHI
jgi:hypothetical protein